MVRPRQGIAAELIAVTLIAGCLGGALAAVIAVHRRRASRRPSAAVVVALAPKVEPVTPMPAPPPPPPAPPLPARVDPTPRMVAELAAAEAEQHAEADKALRRISSLDAATHAARAESDRWRRSLAVARTQIDSREAEARATEGKAEMAAFERDALARRRDAIKQDLERDRERPSDAVLPHRGPNGTWRRPIVLECDSEGVHVRPGGPSFDVTDISSSFGLRGNVFTAAITREAVRIQRQQAPDGGDVTPYIFFIVRPGGIRVYYESRTRLERLGIAFGYELAESEWKIDFPDLDRPETWDGSPPDRPDPVAGRERAEGSRPSRAEIDAAFVWPKTAPGLEGRGNALGLGDEPRGDGQGGTAPDSSLGGNRGTAGTRSFDGVGADEWDKALRRSGPSRLVGRVPWSRGGDGPAGDPGAGLPRGGQSAWESATNGGLPSLEPDGLADLGGPDVTSSGGDRGDGSPPGTAGSRRLVAGMPPRPTMSGGDPGPTGGSEADGMIPARRPPSRGGSRSVEGSRSGAGSRSAEQPGGGDQGSGARAASGREGQPARGRGAASGSSNGAPGSDGQAGGNAAEARAGAPGAGPPSPFEAGARAPRPLELVLACGPKGVAVQPGDYRVTKATLGDKETLLVAQLQAIVREEEAAHPGRPIRPSIRYLIQPGGQAMYSLARGQLDFSGTGWPSSVGFAGGDAPRLFSTDDW